MTVDGGRGFAGSVPAPVEHRKTQNPARHTARDSRPSVFGAPSERLSRFRVRRFTTTTLSRGQKTLIPRKRQRHTPPRLDGAVPPSGFPAPQPPACETWPVLPVPVARTRSTKSANGQDSTLIKSSQKRTAAMIVSPRAPSLPTRRALPPMPMYCQTANEGGDRLSRDDEFAEERADAEENFRVFSEGSTKILATDFGELFKSMGSIYCDDEDDDSSFQAADHQYLCRRDIKKMTSLDKSSGEKVITEKAFVDWYIHWLYIDSHGDSYPGDSDSDGESTSESSQDAAHAAEIATLQERIAARAAEIATLCAEQAAEVAKLKQRIAEQAAELAARAAARV